MPTYGQFCPVAKAAEIIAERWTPLILRELLLGSRRFNELESGLPHISRALLVSRLRALERAGVVARRPGLGRRGLEYHLTPAGEALRPVIDLLGEWGQRWANQDIRSGDIDPGLLMWDMRRRINRDQLPPRRVVVQFDFRGAYIESWWLVLEPGEVSVCLEPPGFDLDLLVTADTLSLHRVWIGRLSLAGALRNDLIQLDGPIELVHAFPHWLALSSFAHIPPARLPRPS